MRSQDMELMIRGMRRNYYFEDPSYRKWSDIIASNVTYTSLRDDTFFASYLSNSLFSDRSVETLREILDKGHELPINWDKFYAYFDDQMNDPENRWVTEITRYDFYSNDETNQCTVKDLLDEYRGKLLLSSYDMV